MQKNRVFGLDLLRSIAIVMVVVSHCSYIIFEESSHPIIVAIRSVGAIGVDLFFVLSGFLIGGILLKLIDENRTRFKDFLLFWKRRWFRTLPNYFLTLTINILIILMIYGALPRNLILYVPFLQNFTNPHPDFFTEAWSLSIEEYSYLLHPILLFLYFKIFKSDSHKKLGFIWVSLGVIMIQILIKMQFYYGANIESYKDWSTGFRKVVLYRFDAIAYGFVLIYFYKQFPNYFKKYNRTLFVLSVGIFVVTHLFIYWYNVMPQTHLAFYVFAYLPIIAISCALAFPIALSFDARKTFRSIIYFLSTRSYAIYLVNYSIILLNLITILNLSTRTLNLKLLVVFIFLILTGLISDLVYRYFEKPILNYRDKHYMALKSKH